MPRSQNLPSENLESGLDFFLDHSRLGRPGLRHLQLRDEGVDVRELVQEPRSGGHEAQEVFVLDAQVVRNLACEVGHVSNFRRYLFRKVRS